MLKDFSFSEPILKIVLDASKKTIMVLGGADTGKTTLVEALADLLAPSFKLGIVDCDMGQSHLGPPTTIAWGKVEESFLGWERIKVEDFYFTGSLSPHGNLLATLCGAKVIFDKAKDEADKVVIDTTGLIHEEEGRLLKENKLDLLKPDVIIALQRERELEHILDPLKARSSPLIFRLSLPSGLLKKSAVQRASYRKERFERYFVRVNRLELSWQELGIRQINGGMNLLQDLTGRLVCLQDRKGRNLALGIIQEIEAHRRLIVSSPIKDTEEIGTVVIGEAKI